MNFTARSHAYTVLKEIQDKTLYANLYTPKYFIENSLTTSDKARITDLVMGSLRWRLFLDSVIEASSKREISALENNLVTLLRLASYEILFGKTAKEILVSEWVNQGKHLLGDRTKGIVNAVLRRVSEKDFESWQQYILDIYQGDLSRGWSHPKWVIDKFLEVLPDKREIVDLLRVNNSPPTNWKVVNFLQQSRERESLSPTAIKAGGKETTDLSSGKNQNIRIQDAASQAAAYLLAHYQRKDGETFWLDACAAPGGKTATLAQERGNDSISIDAYDIHPHKKRLIEHNVRGLENVQIEIADSRLSPWRDKKYDRIMLDAPCTGLGAIRRRAESRWTKEPQSIAELIITAKELFDACFKSLKVNGYLAYVVCSPIKEETEDFINWVLENYPEAALVNPAECLAAFSSDSAANLVDVTQSGLRFWPHKHETDAMFIALITKR
jgi:16S rRNA (cytosine967-C5)-methyltransferase